MAPKPRTAIQRAWPKIKLAGPDDCWLWMGSTNNMPRPYGHLLAEGTTPGNRRSVYAHRLMYETFVGPIPEGLQIDHLCNVSLCCNPAHLEVVTQQVNLARKGAHPNSLKTHCIRGHEFTPENTARRKDHPGRICKTCRRDHVRARRRRQAAAG